MQLRRRGEATATATTGAEPALAWGEIPAKPAHEPLIKAPRAADAVAATAPPQAA